MELKQCPNKKQFKKSYYEMIFMSDKEKEIIEIQSMSLFRKFYLCSLKLEVLVWR